MAKIRNITPKQWEKFEKARSSHMVLKNPKEYPEGTPEEDKDLRMRPMTEREYFEILLHTDREVEHVQDIKQQTIEAINAQGKAEEKLKKQKAKSRQLAKQVSELVATSKRFEEERTELVKSIQALEAENDEYQARIDEQKQHIETSEKDHKADLTSVTTAAKQKISELEATITDLSKELATAKEQLSEKEDLTLEQAEEILSDE